MNFKIFFFAALLGISPFVEAAAQKRAMTFDDFDSWNTISQKELSANGSYVALQFTPWRGDAKVLLYDNKGKELAQYTPAVAPLFSNSSNYLLLTVKPSLKEVEELKLKKTKKENMPKDKLLIRDLNTGNTEVIDGVLSYKSSPEKGDWLVYQKKTDDTLFVRSMDGKKKYAYAKVSNFIFAPKAEKISFISNTKGDSAVVCILSLTDGRESKVADGKLDFKQITFSKDGMYLAFFQKMKGDKDNNGYSLYLSKDGAEGVSIASTGAKGIPADWITNSSGNLSFTNDNGRLFFGTSPAYRQKDTTILADNCPDVQIWKWDEPKQYPQQVLDKNRDMNKTYTAVYDIKNKAITQLADKDLPDIRLAKEGEANFALASTTKPYAVESMWEGSSRSDIYIINIKTAEKELFKKGFSARISVSPAANYLYWYQPQDSSWYTYSVADKKEYRITDPKTFISYDDENDVPDYPSNLGLAGWSKDDKDILINDKFDIWKFSPKGDTPAVNLTKNGKDRGITYRYKSLDSKEKSIDLTKSATITGFNNTTKGSGIYSVMFDGKSSPVALMEGEYLMAYFAKASHSNAVIYTKETFGEFPDVYLSDLLLKKSVKLSNANPQQSELKWGKSKLISWISLDGKPLEGVLYMPEDFDPSKKYPMIVSFYEKNSSALFAHRIPEPHRSTVDYHFYTSNGYLVFNPDIVYEDGYPGLSAHNCIMPGITTLIQQGFVDKNRIAAQGHSWGGYQVAYLATRTDLFACIESGAPVVNMYSAYGGMRWGGGINRSFQYEHQQSRIGGTIWEKPLQYLENSPLFYMDKVKTPILIMHNDQDGHVPWYQGIEYFVSLKRLQKPVWMLNYTGEVHWPQRYANKVDFQKRMFGFFEHYLKGAPMPEWMKEGIPATEKDFELKY